MKFGGFLHIEELFLVPLRSKNDLRSYFKKIIRWQINLVDNHHNNNTPPKMLPCCGEEACNVLLRLRAMVVVVYSTSSVFYQKGHPYQIGLSGIARTATHWIWWENRKRILYRHPLRHGSTMSGVRVPGHLLISRQWNSGAMARQPI